MNPLQKILYQRITINREKRQDIAAEFGISRETLNILIRTGTIHSIEVVKRIAEKSGVSPDDLCG